MIKDGKQRIQISLSNEMLEALENQQKLSRHDTKSDIIEICLRMYLHKLNNITRFRMECDYMEREKVAENLICTGRLTKEEIAACVGLHVDVIERLEKYIISRIGILGIF